MAITLEQAQARLDALMSTTSLSVRIGDRQVVNYTSQADLDAAIARWARIVAQLENAGSGRSNFGFSLADLRCRRL